MLTRHFIAVGIAFLMDLCLGDPKWLYHPICLIGNWIQFLVGKILPRCGKVQKRERLGGMILVLLVLLFSVLVPGLCLLLAHKIHPFLSLILECFWSWQLLAAKSLKVESSKVLTALQENLEKGRYAVSMIVGRDTQQLSKEGVIKATVETIAENTSDGVVAPLFYLSIFGVLGGFFYKAVNTMDSMVGYQNENYQYFGTAAAKLDDFCNWLPARLCAFFMMGAAFGLGCIDSMHFNARAAYRIWKRDRRNHKSPNSAQTESVCAGALGIQLAGDASYFGKQVSKPFIGDPVRAVEVEDITRANRLMYVTSALFYGACMVLLGLLVRSV